MNDFFSLFAKFNSEFMGLIFFLMLTFLSALVFYLIYFRKNLSADTHEVPESLVKNYANNRSYPQEVGELNNADLINELSRLRKELSSKTSGAGDESSRILSEENNDLKLEVERLENELKSSSDSSAMKQLQQENEELGLKLKEYEVIESDLANLKQIQDENTRLKELIRGKDLDTEFQDDLSKIAGEKAETEPSDMISGIDDIVQDKSAELESSNEDSSVDTEKLEPSEENQSEPQEAVKVVDEGEVINKVQESEQGLNANKSEGKAEEEADVVSLEKDGVEKSADELLSEFEKMLG